MAVFSGKASICAGALSRVPSDAAQGGVNDARLKRDWVLEVPARPAQRCIEAAAVIRDTQGLGSSVLNHSNVVFDAADESEEGICMDGC